MSKQELIDLKDEIERAKEDKAKDEGRLSSLMERLSEEYGLNSLDEAEKKIAEIEKEVSVLDKEYDTGLKDLREKYQW